MQPITEGCSPIEVQRRRHAEDGDVDTLRAVPSMHARAAREPSRIGVHLVS